MGPKKKKYQKLAMDGDGMTKRIYISVQGLLAFTCTQSITLFFHSPLNESAPFWIPGPDTASCHPAISPRFLGSQDRVLIELLFLLKIIKSDSRPDPGAWTRFPSRRVFIPGRFILSLISTATFPSPSLFFFSAGPRSRSRPGPSCIVHLPALLPSHDVLTCYASASPRAYAYRSASDRSEAAEHYRGRNSNPVAEQA